MRRRFVAGNWKMNGTRAAAAALVADVVRGAAALDDVDIALCPPAILIPLVAAEIERTRARIAWGGQNLHPQSNGAYTGEISGSMLRDYGCTYVIVGHSERRTLFGETDAAVAEKFAAAQSAGLVPILCVGETLAEREGNQTEAVVARQLRAVVERHGAPSLARAVVAYE